MALNEKKRTRTALAAAAAGDRGNARRHPVLFTNLAGETSLERTPQLTQHRKWYFSRHNALPREQKRKMFVDNELGESIPASDSEDEGKGKESAPGIDGAGASTRWSFEEDLVACGLYEKLDRGQKALEAAARVLYTTVERKHIFAVHHRIAILQAPEGAARDVLAYGSINHMLNRWKGDDPSELTPRYHEHSTLPAALDSFENLFCYRCRKFDCGTHLPGMYILPLKRRADSEPAILSSKPCGGECFLRVPPVAAGSRAKGISSSGHRWTPLDDAVLSRGLTMFGEDLCSLTLLLAKSGSISCSDVRDRLLELQVIRVNSGDEALHEARAGGGGLSHGGIMVLKGGEAPAAAPLPPAGPVQKSRKTSLKKRSNNVATIRKRMRKPGMLWAEYVPCDCHARGKPCGEDCPCVQAGNFCERFCSCAAAGAVCKNRFMGCNCKSSCDNRLCPCYASGRECDPDLCHRGGSQAGDGTDDPRRSVQYITKCKNMALRQLRCPCPGVRMGVSTVSGMGAFLIKGARKGDLIGEYTGEIISQQEADRRGKIYDRNDCSYLFNLNDGFALDAEIKGNKLRFANHSANPNCEPKVVLVDGEHRVAIYARKDIAPGQEIFYDYKYEADKAPEWAREDSD